VSVVEGGSYTKPILLDLPTECSYYKFYRREGRGKYPRAQLLLFVYSSNKLRACGAKHKGILLSGGGSST